MRLEERIGCSKFDGEKAKQLRISVYTNLTDFALVLNERLGRKNSLDSVRSTVRNYETGAKQLKSTAKGKIIEVYIDWLREQGYNPFNLNKKRSHNQNGFSGEEAQQVRAGVYPNLIDFARMLSEKIGTRARWRDIFRTIRSYEDETTEIRPSSKGKIINVYMEWLKEYNYNPFRR